MTKAKEQDWKKERNKKEWRLQKCFAPAIDQAAIVEILARFYYFHLVPLLLQASLLLVPFLFQVLFLCFCHPYLFSLFVKTFLPTCFCSFFSHRQVKTISIMLKFHCCKHCCYDYFVNSSTTGTCMHGLDMHEWWRVDYSTELPNNSIQQQTLPEKRHRMF